LKPLSYHLKLSYTCKRHAPLPCHQNRFYPLENVIFTMSIPRGQESELSGFYTYCRSILTWLPPLIFTAMNESGIAMTWGLLSLVIFFSVGLVFLQLMAPWEEMVAEAGKVNRMT